jgi:UDP-N-acetylmuramoyl-tripeptide--D-alanyl-D-alanine ligase
VTPQGEAEVALALPGRHNVRNALAAAALALAAGAPWRPYAGLDAAVPVAGGWSAIACPAARPWSTTATTPIPARCTRPSTLLAAGDGEPWLVLGDMRELGADAAALHAEAGRRAKAAGIARLYALGELSVNAAEAFGGNGAPSMATTLAQALRALTGRTGVRLLVKGSRGSRMDRVVGAARGAGRTPGEGTHAA